MASILVGDIDTTMINGIPNELIFKNILNNNIQFFQENELKALDTFKIDESYKYRPDKVAFEYYGEDGYYPLVLYANNIGSILQFNPEIIGDEIKLLKPEYALKLIIDYRHK